MPREWLEFLSQLFVLPDHERRISLLRTEQKPPCATLAVANPTRPREDRFPHGEQQQALIPDLSHPFLDNRQKKFDWRPLASNLIAYSDKTVTLTSPNTLDVVQR